MFCAGVSSSKFPLLSFPAFVCRVFRALFPVAPPPPSDPPLQGYLAYPLSDQRAINRPPWSETKNRHPVGPYSRTMPKLLWWSLGGVAVSYERGTPVLFDPPDRRLATAPAERCTGVLRS